MLTNRLSVLRWSRSPKSVTIAIMGHRLRVLAICAALSCPAADLSRCSLIPGTDLLWATPGIEFVLVGEMHGTTETPAIFSDLVCSARSTKRPIVVGVERPVEEQEAINIFLAPADHEAAVNGLLAQKGWNELDGRSSRAMLKLLEDLRAMKQQGMVADVVAFSDARPGEPAAKLEERMAVVLTAAGNRYPDALVIALAGNLHPSKAVLKSFGYSMMASYIPAERTISLFVSDLGGEAWTSSNGECQPHNLRSTGGEHRGITLSKTTAPIPGYDGVLATGLKASPSPPALSDPPAPPACSKT